ncbi:MAG: Hpt domain-containing protein [Cytophagales bacterium]|nr:Hpt domain-containing protein [Cytophagales bacterium]
MTLESDSDPKPKFKYDMAILDNLTNGNKVFAGKLMQIFLDTVPEMLTQIDTQVKAKDFDNLSFYAHKLKSTINGLSISYLSDAILELEQRAKQRQECESITSLAKQIREELESVHTLFQMEIGK